MTSSGEVMTDCTPSDVQIERWRLLLQERQQDEEELQHRRKSDAQRRNARKEMLALLASFLHEEIDLESFRETFDLNTRNEWDVLGFKGMSGAMFLNTLVKYLPDQGEVAAELREVLPVPDSVEHGRRRMQHFYSYLSSVIRDSQVTKRQVQPARIPFFVSGWWHLQDLETWPIFYTSGRRALEQDSIYEATGDAVSDYFRFRDCFLNLATALGCTSWEMEHLLSWKDERKSTVEQPTPSTDAATSDEELSVTPAETEELDHTYIQWLLARIGRSTGCRVWIAANDHNRTWKGQRLGDLSIEQLPRLGLDEESQRIIGYIDVIWIQGYKRVAAAFEVEHTTSIYSGLLRMADLVALSPNLNFPLYIVSPESRLDKVKRELSRPTFQTLGLHEQCGYFSFEALNHDAESIMRWASDPDAIERLAKKVESVTEEGF
jgi:hypothetical protein